MRVQHQVGFTGDKLFLVSRNWHRGKQFMERVELSESMTVLDMKRKMVFNERKLADAMRLG